MNELNAYSLAVCFPVWNRCDLFQASFASLLRQLEGIEPGLFPVMRKSILSACVPFPHHRNTDEDWELMTWHTNSTSARTRQLAVVDYVEHLGIYDTT